MARAVRDCSYQAGNINMFDFIEMQCYFFILPFKYKPGNKTEMSFYNI